MVDAHSLPTFACFDRDFTDVYRPDEILPEKIRPILEPPNTEDISLRAHFQLHLTRLIVV